MGGVESHMYQLSQRLVSLGHKVVIITHRYNDRVGIRYLSSGVKVYYIPQYLVADQVSLPTIYGFFPLFRYIVIRENIQIVHAHQAFSSMCLESILHARTMGLRAVFTDHSLFGFEDTASILTNKLLKFTLCDINHVICVSHTCKENTVLRANLDPKSVSVIPNAVNAQDFTPDPECRPKDKLVIVIASRLVYRKGVDLMVSVIPKICALYPLVNFIIAGDGPKRVDLEQMREQYVLQDRVTLLGSVHHSEVRNVLVQGHIFLNTSLTEAFCIAIVEAASAGLLVVSTRVGGVPEVLPQGMILFASPDVDELVQTVSQAISMIQSGSIDPWKTHDRIKEMYSWTDVACRTERVYNQVMQDPNVDLAERFEKYHKCGPVAGKLAVMIMAVHYLFYQFLEWFVPRIGIPSAPTFDRGLFLSECQRIKERISLKED